ncbi:MAG: DUF4920 domain-containing protein, partial [Pseudomonadota bacterium]
MRRIMLALLLLLTSPLVTAEDGIRLSEPVVVTDQYEVFGARLPEGAVPVSLSTVIAESEPQAEQQVVIETEIVQVCQMKGCFFIARDGDAVARVKFKDYGFFVPTDAAGKTVILVGTLDKVRISADLAAHYAEDLGEPMPTSDEDVFEYQITAT